MAVTTDLKSVARNGVQVRLLPPLPIRRNMATCEDKIKYVIWKLTELHSFLSIDLDNILNEKGESADQRLAWAEEDIEAAVYGIQEILNELVTPKGFENDV